MVELEGKCKEKFTNKRRGNSGPEFRTLEATERYTSFDLQLHSHQQFSANSISEIFFLMYYL